MTDVVPQRPEPLLALLSRLASKLPTHATALGITPAELASVSADSAMLGYLNRLADNARTFSVSVTTYRTTLISGDEGPSGPIPTFTPPATPPAVVPAGMVPRTRRLIQRVRSSANFTDAIAADLGLPTASAPAAPVQDDVRPMIDSAKAGHLPGVGVSIPWVKGRHTGVAVIGQRGAEDAAYESLGDDLYSPFIDKRPNLTLGQPETRRYRFQYKDGDDVIGQLSDIVVITVPS